MIKKKRLIKAGLLCAMLPLCMGSDIQAASFDCTKTTTKVEKLICGNPVISKLDDELSAVYKTVIGKANENEKQELIMQQRHWLKHTRNVCETEVCFKHAYWSRQAELAFFFQPKSPLYAKESDKAEAIQKVLATAPLYSRHQSDPPLCRQLLTALKEMKGIRFIEPVVQTMSYEDPALDPWKQRFCERGGAGRPFNFSYECDPGMSEGEDIDIHLQECAAYYGLPPYKIFELPPLTPSAQTRFFFYLDQTYGPANQEWKKPLCNPSAHFHEFRPGDCDGFVGGVSTSGMQGKDPSNYNSIIEYEQRYFIMHLEYAHESYRLDISPIDENTSCAWSSVKK